VEDVAWHPDGSLLATAGLDNTVRMWNPVTGDQLYVLTEHTNWVEQVTFSLDGGLLATASRDGTVRVWDTASRSCLGVLADRGEAFLCVAVSPDAGMIAAGDYDGRVSVWDWPEGTLRKVSFAHNARVWSVAFLGRERLASAGEDRLVRLWDCDTGASAGRLEGHRLGVTSVRPLECKRQVVTGSGDQTVRLWDVATGTCHLELEGFEQPMRTVAVSPAADLIVVAGNDGALHRWSLDGCYLGTWTDHTEAVDCVAFNATGDRLASCGNDRTIRLWDVASGRVQVLAGHEGYVYEVAFSPDGQRLSSGGQFGQVLNWDTTTGRRIFTITPFRSTAGPIRYTPDGRLLVVAGGDHRSSLYLYDPSNGDRVALLQDDHLGGCDAVAVTPDGRHIVSCVAGLVDVWDIATRRRVGWFPGHRGVAKAVVCHPDNRTVSTVGDDGVIRVWRIGESACRAELIGHTQGVWGLACMPNGEQLISASMDGTARVWSSDGTLMQTLVAPRPYEGVDITGATGLTEAQRSGLRALGAVENVT
jgi:WD40 repeat protein